MKNFDRLFRLDGKRALVTGAGRGIGLLAAQALAAFGAHVTIVSRTERAITKAAMTITRDGGNAEPLVLDVTQTSEVRRLLNRLDPFDVLVNNAGTNRPGPFIEVEPESFDFVAELNIKAAFFVAQAVICRLIKAGQPGSIINISSQMGHVGLEAVHHNEV